MDSGVGFVQSIWFFFSPTIEEQKQLIILMIAKLNIGCGLVVYRRLLTNPLHGKAAEQCLANS